MSHKYAKLTNTELLILIDQIENENKALRQKTLSYVAQSVLDELAYLGKDLQWLLGKVYGSGIKARQAFESLAAKKLPAAEAVVPHETSFPY